LSISGALDRGARECELDRLSLQIEDQRAFAVAVHKLLTALEMIDEAASAMIQRGK